MARSGTIDRMLFCGTCWSYTTRLLKTPIIGRIAAVVDSSRSDMLAGLSKWEVLRTPPGFWATAASAAINTNDNDPAAARARRPRFIPQPPLFNDPGTRPDADSVRRLPRIERPGHRQSRRAQRTPAAFVLSRGKR